MQEKEIDFFKSSSEKIQKTIHQIDKKPFLKVAFLTIALGCAIGFGINLSSTLVHYYENHNEIKKADEQVLLNINIGQIKKIKAEEFSDFINYLKNNENIYNDLSYLTINSLLQAEKVSYGDTSDASGRNKNISDELTRYKKDMESIINTINNIYINIQQNNLKNISEDDINLFLINYRSYNAGIYTRDKDIEKTLHASLYDVKRVNKETNIKNNVYEQVKELEKTIDLGYNKNTSNNLKNKP